MTVSQISFRTENRCIILDALVNGLPAEFHLADDGKFYPVFTVREAERLSLKPAMMPTPTCDAFSVISLDKQHHRDEPCVIADVGHNTLGLAYFIGRTISLNLDFRKKILTIEWQASFPATYSSSWQR